MKSFLSLFKLHDVVLLVEKLVSVQVQPYIVHVLASLDDLKDISVRQVGNNDLLQVTGQFF
jgi:L-lysine 2,3-aminomutase